MRLELPHPLDHFILRLFHLSRDGLLQMVRVTACKDNVPLEQEARLREFPHHLDLKLSDPALHEEQVRVVDREYDLLYQRTWEYLSGHPDGLSAVCYRVGLRVLRPSLAGESIVVT